MNRAIATLYVLAFTFQITVLTTSQLWAQAAKTPKQPQLKQAPTKSPPTNNNPTETNQQASPQNNGSQNESPKVPNPEPLATKEGKAKGWQVLVPGHRALATPAVVDGKLFIGGGFGSHEFYAFDARTGKMLWLYRTADDGPTAAVVADGYVCFNTESCELEILDLAGKPVWKKWLGDPLMSMPALADGKVFMCYPDSKGGGQHYLACFAVKDGKELWKKPIAGEIITTPVIAQGHVYLATLEGTMYCFSQSDGALAWQEKKNATSSPIVWNGQCYFSRREQIMLNQAGKQVRQQLECISARSTDTTATVNDFKSTTRNADYLDIAKRRAGRSKYAAQQSMDDSVGFGGSSKGGAKIAQAEGNLGLGSVAGVWAYQGSKPFLADGRLYAAMGDTVECVDPKTDKVIWKNALHDAKEKEDDKKELLDGTLTPPAVVHGKLFLGTTRGEVICLSAATGEEHWRATVGEPITFQPAVADGRVYVSTDTGHLYCLETGDEADHGWLMWGGDAAHNGLPRSK